jgi:hypothetical protein
VRLIIDLFLPGFSGYYSSSAARPSRPNLKAASRAARTKAPPPSRKAVW